MYAASLVEVPHTLLNLNCNKWQMCKVNNEPSKLNGDIFISAMFVLEALENVRCRPMFHNPLYLFGTTVEHDNQCFKYMSMWSMVLNLNYATHWEHICGGVIKQHQYFALLQTDMHITLRHNTMWHNIMDWDLPIYMFCRVSILCQCKECTRMFHRQYFHIDQHYTIYDTIELSK